jgi:siderophore synthetase component
MKNEVTVITMYNNVYIVPVMCYNSMILHVIMSTITIEQLQTEYTHIPAEVAEQIVAMFPSLSEQDQEQLLQEVALIHTQIEQSITEQEDALAELQDLLMQGKKSIKQTHIKKEQESCNEDNSILADIESQLV